MISNHSLRILLVAMVASVVAPGSFAQVEAITDRITS